MPSPARSIVFWTPLSAATSVSVGQVVIPNATNGESYVVATTANRGTRRSEAIALTSHGGTSIGTVELQQAGTIDASISGLSAGAASWVRCSATGTIERCTPSGSDDIIGWAEADGRVHLLFGVLTASITNGGASTPTGTGLRKVVTGVEDAAASLLVNADVNAAAAIAVTKIATGSADGQVLARAAGANAFALIANANVDAAAAIAGTKISPSFGAQNITTTGGASFATWTPNGTYTATAAAIWPYNGASTNKIFNYVDSTAAARNLLSVGAGDAYELGATQLVATLLGYQFVITAQTAASTVSHRKWSFIDGAVGSTQFVLENGRNISFFAAGSYGSGDGVAFIGNATTVPTTNPSGGYILYATANSLRGRGGSGTVTTIGAAEPHCPQCGADFVYEAENERYGHVALCFPCLLDALDEAGVSTKAAFIRRRAA